MSEVLPVKLWREELGHTNPNYLQPRVEYHVTPSTMVLEATMDFNPDVRAAVLKLAYNGVTY